MNRRGFSLIELMMVVGITSVVVAGISLVLVKQSAASVKQTQQRSLEETGRQALLELAYAVRMAGSGIAPTAAFDFDHYACSSPGTATTCNNEKGRDTPPKPASPGLRDKTDGPDELVVSYRDPVFVRTVTSLSPLNATGPYTVGIDKALTAPIKAGRIAMILCSGADPVTYLAFSNDAAVNDMSVTLRPVQDADGVYPKQGATESCFTSGTLVLVERVRYFVANDFDGVPALFRDRGRAGDPAVLFRGIEDLQLVYTIGPPGTGATGDSGCGTGPLQGWVYGATGCTVVPIDAIAADPDWVNDTYDASSRFKRRPANIRSVQINLVARSPQKSPDKAGDLPIAVAGTNRAPPAPDPAGQKYLRSVFTIVEQTPNLLSRAMIMPDLGG